MSQSRQSAGPRAGIPVLMTQYILPLRQLWHRYQGVKKAMDNAEDRLKRARKRDIDRYNALGRRLRELVELQDNGHLLNEAALAEVEAELAQVSGRYRILSNAFWLQREAAKKDDRFHQDELAKLWRRFGELLDGAKQLATVFGDDLRVDGEGRDLWKELRQYEKLYNKWGFPSMSSRLKLFN